MMVVNNPLRSPDFLRGVSLEGVGPLDFHENSDVEGSFPIKNPTEAAQQNLTCDFKAKL